MWENLLNSTNWVGGISVDGMTVISDVGFTVSGGGVTGVYRYEGKAGVIVDGKITKGKIKNRTTSITGLPASSGGNTATAVSGITIEFEWDEKGNGIWKSLDENSLEGTWGTGSSNSNGGSWDISEPVN